MNNNEMTIRQENATQRSNTFKKVACTAAVGAAGFVGKVWWDTNKDEINRVLAKKTKQITNRVLKATGFKKKDILDYASSAFSSLTKLIKK